MSGIALYPSPIPMTSKWKTRLTIESQTEMRKLINKGPVNLEDTQVAYSHLNSWELRKASLLFQIMGNPLISQLGQKSLLLALRLHLPVSGLIKFGFFSHFCGGTSLEDCESLVEKLRRKGVDALLDFAGEQSSSEQERDQSCTEVLRAIDSSQDRGLRFSVFKPTAIIDPKLLEKVSNAVKGQGIQIVSKSHLADLNSGERKDWERGTERFRKLCQKAHSAGIQVLVDAEESWIQYAADALVWENMLKWNKERPIVFQTIQMYRTDRLDYLYTLNKEAESLKISVGIKLVRGAYMEKERARAKAQSTPDPIHSHKDKTDRDYTSALSFVLERLENISLFVGTHNQSSIELALNFLAKQKNLSPALIQQNLCFSQLLGMSDPLTFNLAHGGYYVSKYVPYGPIRAAIPYLIRRAQENSSVTGQVNKDSEAIRKEIQSRKERGLLEVSPVK